MGRVLVFLFDFLALGVATWLAYKLAMYGRREKYLPPGPPTTFLLGNLRDIPPKKAFHTLVGWAREYGEIHSLKLGHKTTIVLNSPAAVEAIMEKGSRVTQNRPKMWLFDHYMYDHDQVIFSSVPSKVYKLRRVLVTFLSQTTTQTYIPIQESESCQLLYDIMLHPDSFFNNIKRFTISLMFSLSYGIRAPRFESPLAALFYEDTDKLNELVADVSALLDFVPILRVMPNWLVSWRKQTDLIKSQEREMTSELMDNLLSRRRETGGGTNSFMEQILDNPKEFGLSENMMHTLPLIMLQAGAGTTASAMLSVILLLVGQDEVLAKAHAELDIAVGRDRLPTISDMEHLPYIQAIIKESERLRPINPLGFPHAATEDQTYDGYLVPAGATVLYNTWALSHDPALFPDPEKFMPERWLDPTVRHANIWPFGFGRRVCPGMHLAKNSVALVITRLLWAFDIKKKVDQATGRDIDVDTLDYAEGVVLCPNKFPATFILRSKENGETIRHETREAIPQLERYNLGMAQSDKDFVQQSRIALY
ncbi:cytochrome P450 [Dacryopinax primogenitus]|uniref:Cytochrome P450 n=1 Tax=Dacryopinax primogenitus (strain DJM 731) TaxID=1858805 RepID=M5G2N8_DACPD|nr:cytochrome P450 [Dacryopinax primogenitus]EJU02480.1 cytochrome P450 [Dacryopinax primogenitus]